MFVDCPSLQQKNILWTSVGAPLKGDLSFGWKLLFFCVCPDYQMTTVPEDVRDKRVVNVRITGCISDLGMKKLEFPGLKKIPHLSHFIEDFVK